MADNHDTFYVVDKTIPTTTVKEAQSQDITERQMDEAKIEHEETNKDGKNQIEDDKMSEHTEIIQKDEVPVKKS